MAKIAKGMWSAEVKRNCVRVGSGVEELIARDNFNFYILSMLSKWRLQIDGKSSLKTNKYSIRLIITNILSVIAIFFSG